MLRVKQGFLLTIMLMAAGIWVTDAPVARAESASGLPGSAASDTVRTNLWLTEALMAEVAEAAASVLPPAPAAVRLASMRDDPRDDIFQAVAARVLADRGYDIYVSVSDSARLAAVDYVFAYSVQNIDLAYPDVGRTLGIWRRWVAREMTVSVLVEVSEEASGRLLLNERIARKFGDRFDSGDFAAVDTDEYEFTTAETEESGWKSRAEEIVVLSTLAGLVAIYFANTGD